MKTSGRSHWIVTFAWLLALILAVLLVSPAAAGIIIVTNGNDSGEGSLRQAIERAADGDTIIFSGDLSIYLATELGITKTLTIDGGAHTVRISGDTGNDGIPNVRVFNVGASGVVTFSHLSIVSGTVSGTVNGAGIYNAGALTLQDSIVAGHVISGTGDGVAIYNSNRVTMTGSTLSDNACGATSSGGGGFLNDGGIAIIQESVIADNTSNFTGGGFYNFAGTLVLRDSIISGNSGVEGGGLFNNFNGVMTVTHSLITGNSGTAGGGVMNRGALLIQDSVISGNSARTGGGVYNRYNTPIVQNCVISGNSAIDAGGGLYANSTGALIVRNSTISENSAGSYGGGAYIDFQNQGVLFLQNCTLSGNRAATGGGVYNRYRFQYQNTIIANSALGGDCFSSGTIATNIRNLVEDNSCAPALSGDPALGVPTGNIAYYPLLPNSPAIDAGDGATCLIADQRGEPRDDLRCDIGAFERRFNDGDTVIKTNFKPGTPYSFGPTWISVTLSAADTGAITVTKHLIYPGGTQDTGEIQATWWISSNLTSGLPLTLSLCYTGAEADGLDEDSLEMFRWDGTTWVDQNAAPDSTHHCVTLPGVTGFSAWTLKDTSVGEAIPNPVGLRQVVAHGYAGWSWLALIALGVAALIRRRAEQRLKVSPTVG